MRNLQAALRNFHEGLAGLPEVPKRGLGYSTAVRDGVRRAGTPRTVLSLGVVELKLVPGYARLVLSSQ